MNTVAVMPSIWAASATPWAWLPAEAATTPAARSSAESRDIRRYAPRILNDPVRWRFSHLRKTGPPASPVSQRDSSMGVVIDTPASASRAFSMSARVTVGMSATVVLVCEVLDLAFLRWCLPVLFVVVLERLLGVLADLREAGQVLDD